MTEQQTSRREYIAGQLAGYPADLQFNLVCLVDPLVALDEAQLVDLQRRVRILARVAEAPDAEGDPVAKALARLLRTLGSAADSAARAQRGEGDLFTRAHEAANTAGRDETD